MEMRTAPGLILEARDQSWRMEPLDDATLTIGRDGRTDVVLAARFASRVHAIIRHDQQQYVFEDTSTNGSYVQTEDRKVQFVRRNRLRLWGEGYLSFGEPLKAETVVRFRVE